MATQREIEAAGIIGAAAELYADGKITEEQRDEIVRIAKEGRGPKLTLVCGHAECVVGFECKRTQK